MPGNQAPIFSKVGDIQWANGTVATANTLKDGSGASVVTVFTADSTNGGWVERIRFKAAGTNIATVARVWINNGSALTTGNNNILYDELTLPATTLSETAALPTYELPLNFALPPGYRIATCVATTVSAGYYVSVIGGKY